MLQGTLQSRGQDERMRFWASSQGCSTFTCFVYWGSPWGFVWKKFCHPQTLTNFLFRCIQTNRKNTLNPCSLGPCISAFAHQFQFVPWAILKGLHKEKLKGINDYMFFTTMGHQYVRSLLVDKCQGKFQCVFSSGQWELFYVSHDMFLFSLWPHGSLVPNLGPTFHNS